MADITFEKYEHYRIYTEDYSNLGVSRDDLIRIAKEIDGVFSVTPAHLNDEIIVRLCDGYSIQSFIYDYKLKLDDFLNYDNMHEPKYSAFGIKYDFGIGTYDKNPNRCKYVEWENEPHYQWLWVAGYWYLISDDVTRETIEKGCENANDVIKNLSRIIYRS